MFFLGGCGEASGRWTLKDLSFIGGDTQFSLSGPLRHTRKVYRPVLPERTQHRFHLVYLLFTWFGSCWNQTSALLTSYFRHLSGQVVRSYPTPPPQSPLLQPGDWIFTVFSFMEVSHQLTIGAFSGPRWHVHKCSAFKASWASHHSDMFAMDGLFLPCSPSSRQAHTLTLAFSLGSLFVPYDWLCSSLDTTHRNSAWSSFP